MHSQFGFEPFICTVLGTVKFPQTAAEKLAAAEAKELAKEVEAKKRRSARPVRNRRM
jgi:hypothetical protein